MSHRGIICRRLALSVIIIMIWAASGGAQPAGLEDLAGPLKGLALQAARGEVNPAAASRLGLRVQGNLVEVTVLFRSAAAAANTNLGAYGGIAELRYENRVQALLPISRLAEVAALPQVAQITPVSRLIPFQQLGYGAVLTQGLQLTNALAFQVANINGAGVKVAVVDLGFAGLTAAEVPTINVVNFRTDNLIAATPHGTAVAQIVADMAPGCDMTLIAVSSDLELLAAIDWIIQQGFDVVNMSAGFVEGPFDGTHPVSQAVNRARAAGIVWVNAAGDQAQQHWQGEWADYNNDGYLDFAVGKDTIQLDLPAGVFQAYLSWFETSGPETANDYDLVLEDNGGQVVARSAVTQNGDDPPKELLVALVPAAGIYNLKIQRMSPVPLGGAPERFHLFTPNVDIEPSLQHPEDSLAIPAEATGALAVGATRGVATPIPDAPPVPLDMIEPFSSRGSIGSSAKPDMVAPDAVATSLAGYNPFFGTSAAAPHVAGAVALLLAEDPNRPPTAIRTLLEQMARKYNVPSEIPESDINAYGFGRWALRVGVNLDYEAPIVRIEFPLNNSTLATVSPRVLISASDRNGVDPNTIQVWLDNILIVQNGTPISGQVTNYSFDAGQGLVQFILNNLTRAHHQLQAEASDWAGNTSQRAICNFRVAAPTLAAGLHLISLPYPDLANRTPAEVFGVSEQALALVRWVPTDSRPSKYHFYPDEFATFQPPDLLVARPPAGLGYFVRLTQPATLNIQSASVMDESYAIKLVYGLYPPRGWNLIGNPYEDYVDWGSVEFIYNGNRYDLREAMDPKNGPITEGVLFEFVSTGTGGYYSFSPDPTQATMQPLKGYWLHVLKDCTLIINKTTASTAQRPAVAQAQQTPAPAPSRTNWLLQLKVQAGAYEDPVNYIGVHSAATAGFDAGLDVSEPPAVIDAVQLYMPQGQNQLAKDMRSPLGNQQTWEVCVSSQLTQTPIVISWPTLNSSVPREVKLWLEDVDGGQRVYMRTNTSYTFQMSEPGVRRLRVVAQLDQSAPLTVSGLRVQQTGGGTVSVTYNVSRPASVGAEVLNIAGRIVRRLGEQMATPGAAQTLLWNGKNEQGALVPSGKYLIRLTACAEDGQSVQIIQPVTVQR